MIRKSLIALAGVAIVAVLALPIANLVVDLPENELMRLETTDPVSSEAVRLISRKCAHCHGAETAQPFYASWPLARNVIREDVRRGSSRVDFLEDLRSDEQPRPSEVVLAKTQRSIENRTMPPLKYRLMHWNHGLSPSDRDLLIEWIESSRVAFADPQLPAELQRRVVRPLVAPTGLDERKVGLGRSLFHDPRLSTYDTVSCASCHALDAGGTDQRQFSVGVGGAEGNVNSPTVFNSSLFAAQFWDGRATTLEDQADGPVNNPIEMASDWDEVISKLRRDRSFTREFGKAYPDGYSKQSLIDAIATFERSLVTPNSKFDRYLRGDEQAMSEAEHRGYGLFRDYACDTCHVGEAMGGQSFEPMGVEADYFADRGAAGPADLGRFNVTGQEADRHRFKVPSLRNVALTYPYLHDGSVDDLGEVVKLMAKYQLGREMEDHDAALVVGFLEALTGELEGRPLG